MSPSGLVITRRVKLVPAPVVRVCTVFAATSRSFAFVVVSALLLLDALLPSAPIDLSTGLTGSIPAYSAIRTSGKVAAALKVTVTLFEPAVAAAMFFA
jgi:hypothetical protein